MTEDALKYVMELHNDPRGLSISMDSYNGNITQIQFDHNRLTENEAHKLLDFARNGSPGISLVKEYEPGPNWV